MIFDCRTHGRVLALQDGVFAADQTLKLGELADDFGLQVRLAEDGGAAGELREVPLPLAGRGWGWGW